MFDYVIISLYDIFLWSIDYVSLFPLRYFVKNFMHRLFLSYYLKHKGVKK